MPMPVDAPRCCVSAGSGSIAGGGVDPLPASAGEKAFAPDHVRGKRSHRRRALLLFNRPSSCRCLCGMQDSLEMRIVAARGGRHG